MEKFIAILAIVSTGFFLFCIYFIFKVIQFVIVAVNLYKKMVKRQDAIIKILLDIRDQTKSFKQKEIIEQLEDESDIENFSSESLTKGKNGSEEDEALEFCYYCGTELKSKVKNCPECGKAL